MRYVLDCSVAVKWFVPEPLADVAERVLGRYETGEISFLAPNTIVAEFGHSLRKLVLGGALIAQKGSIFLDQFLGMSFERVPVEPFAAEAFRLALTHTATFYDALYVTLAVREDLSVLTADDRMANAFTGLGRTVLLRDFPS